MKKIILVLILFFASGHAVFSNIKKSNTNEFFLDGYKKYALARCITNNYEQMGVEFNKLSLKDYTMGFIDVEEGFALSSDNNNVLDIFIKKNTGDFHKPKHIEGDLAQLNMVIYNCIDFYHSKNLDIFLKKIISIKMKEQER